MYVLQDPKCSYPVLHVAVNVIWRCRRATGRTAPTAAPRTLSPTSSTRHTSCSPRTASSGTSTTSTTPSVSKVGAQRVLGVPIFAVIKGFLQVQT